MRRRKNSSDPPTPNWNWSQAATAERTARDQQFRRNTEARTKEHKADRAMVSNLADLAVVRRVRGARPL